MFSGIYTFIKKKPFLTVLIIISASISILNLKPYLYLAGWDNYSSYLDLPINIFRTFFSTWRDYRALGSPSDSEVTDLFRQVFSFILSLVFPKTLVDQLYYVTALNLGIFSMYALGYKIAKAIFSKNTDNTVSLDLFAFTSAFFYLFNLNTLSVFYFPILPYISRFFGIPLTFLILTELLQKKHHSLLRMFLMIVGLLLASTSYITATVFVTVVMVAILYGFFQKSIGKIVVIFLFWGALYSFWTFPFINYTAQKSSIIRLARTFIDANETQLNRPKSFYSLADQLILKPNFFDTKYSSLDGNSSESFYPLSDELQGRGLPHYIQYVFALLMIGGSIFILVRPKKFRSVLWVPLTVLLFLFLSMKEYSPLGFLYAFINEHLPLFGVLFRFGDTKFHPLIAFAGSIAAGVCLVSLHRIAINKIPHWSKTATIIILLLVFIPILITYRSYFQGQLIGFFMYNKIPAGYFKIAQTINKDPTDGRVIHFPFDTSMYWRSHNWGYLGSSFFNFMITKPYLDKTFEPGSMENAYLMKRIGDMLTDAKELDGIGYIQKATALHDLLSRVGVSYILLDETVSAQSPSRGMTFWGKYDVFAGKGIVDLLEEVGLVQKVQTEEVSLQDYKGIYPQLLSTDVSQMQKLFQADPKKLILYKLANTSPRFKTISQITTIDGHISNLLETDIVSSGGDVIQRNEQDNSVFLPFHDLGLPMRSMQSNSELSLVRKESVPLSSLSLTTQTDADIATHMVEVKAKRDKNMLVITLSDRYLPTVNSKEFLLPLETIEIPIKDFREDLLPGNIDKYVNDWHVLPMKQISPLRVRVGDVVLPVPSPLTDEFQTLGNVTMQVDSLDLEVLSPLPKAVINPEIFNLTDNPNCLGDNREDYSYDLSKTKQAAVVKTQNGSLCLWADLGQNIQKESSYAELQFSSKKVSSDQDGSYELDKRLSAKPLLKEIITALPKPSSLKVCIKEGVLDQCYNNHQIVNLHDADTYIFPIHSPEGNFYNPIALFTVINVGHQSQQVDFHDVSLTYFESIYKEKILILNSDIPQGKVLSQKDALQLSIPKALSKYSYYLKAGTDGYSISTGACEKENAYRTYRVSGENSISYFDNCSNTFTQKVSSSSDNFILWSTQYNLLAGRFPEMKITDSYSTLSEDIASLYQGYPDIQGFMTFANPEMFYDSKEEIEAKFNRISSDTAYGYIRPHPGLSNKKDKEYTLQQFGENEGVMTVSGFDIYDLPTTWSDLQITKGQPIQTYDTPKNIAFTQILPSLWKVQITKNPTDSQYLLEFNTGYDAQWAVYDSVPNVLFGKSIGTNHSRCNGYSNCFEVPANWSQKQKIFYVFYWPERLAALGWIVTFTTAIAGMYLFSKRSQKNV